MIKLQKIIESIEKLFENRISLGDSSNVDKNLKPLKVGEDTSPIEISEDSVRISGNLEANSITIQGAPVATLLNDLVEVTYSGGDLSIAGFDKLVSDANFELDVSGDIDLNADGSDVNFKDGTTQLASVSGGAASELKLYNQSDVGDYFSIATIGNGTTTIKTVDNSGANGDIRFNPDGWVTFQKGCGFDQTAISGATTTVCDFKEGNKVLLSIGANITDLNINFPHTSGNFILLVKQDATGSRLITNYNAKDYEGNAAAGGSTLKFAGGSNPTLTTTANKVDIISIYWDDENEVGYATITKNF